MANLSADTTNRTSGANSDFKNKILQGEHQLEKFAQSAVERVGSMASDFATSTAGAMKSRRDYVKENPVKGVAIAAAAGLIVGSLITMAMRNGKKGNDLKTSSCS